MTTAEYENVKRAVAIIDQRDDTQDQRLAALETSLSAAIQRISQLENRPATVERQGHRRQ